MEEAYENYIFHKEVGSTAKIFVDKTNIRDLPGLTGNIVDALPQGTSVKIIQETNIINKIQERSAQWYKNTVQWERRICLGSESKCSQ